MDIGLEKLDRIETAQRKLAGSRVHLARVGPLDPDFIVILFVAGFFDATFAVLAIFDALVVPWIVRFILSLLAFVVVGGWMFLRINRIARAKGESEESLQNILQSLSQQRKAIASRQAKEVAIKQAEKQVATKQAGKVATRKVAQKVVQRKAAKKAGLVAAKRGGIAVGGTIAPFIGAFPFFTLSVLLMLKEK